MKRISCHGSHANFMRAGITQCPRCYKHLDRLCSECGARVTNINPLVTTCDEVCTRAKRLGLTREMVLKREAQAMPFEEDDGELSERIAAGRRSYTPST
jgi:hypothetical protein